MTLSDGLALVTPMEPGSSLEEKLFSARYSCPYCDYSLQELEPRMFSFNNPNGACPECDGLGTRMEIDPERVVPDPELSISEGAKAEALSQFESMGIDNIVVMHQDPPQTNAGDESASQSRGLSRADARAIEKVSDAVRAVVMREWWCFRRVWFAPTFGSVFEPLLYLVGFGYGFGGLAGLGPDRQAPGRQPQYIQFPAR